MSSKKEIILYGIFGVCTTVINIVIFYILCKLGISYKLSTTVAFVFSIIFAYISNKIFVFKIINCTLIENIREFFRFIWARIFTFIIDYFGLIFMIDIIKFNSIMSKILINIVIVLLNYIISKKKVFVLNK